MNRDRVAGSWKQFIGKLKEQWGRLTSDDARVDAGRREQLAGSIQLRHGASKEEAARQVEDFLHRNRNWNPSRRSLRV